MSTSASGFLRQLAAQGAMIERLASDSRRCAPGVAFLAYPGEAADGRAHIDDAIRRGAAAVLWEHTGFTWREEWRVPNAAVPGLKQHAGELAAEFYGRPSESLWMCGVTGTNGKTSCSQWIAAALNRKGIYSNVIGTLGYGTPGALQPLPNTTPDALEVQALLKKFVDEKSEAVAMEVSSHGLAQGRVNGVAFDCALFTNLSHDHLDYHGTMQAYAAAKEKLFDTPGLCAAVLNFDDAMGVRLARRLRGKVRVIGYGFADTAAAAADEYLPAKLLPPEHTRQLGRFNLANALGVLGCLLAYGLERKEAAVLLADLPPVPGRMQRIAERPLVVVDYAHTPDALEKVLQALRPVTQERRGKLAVVFGAGGDRDPTKRPLMGAVATRLADKVLVTSDNPRSEDPLEIIRQIGAAASEPDRARAIEKIIAEAASSDVVLIAGKGHEDYQEIAGRLLPFSDAAVARAAISKRSSA
ncbi:MAG TPA: UDP-N-acetylmuramoyl-L-alanyl-D-glutamate--2,6-diaminopimelate ligase [Burkholderiales bacterium]|nr:UDP-N-acetylmuramoyl-L-alanyl-D-glutamate--2,6-diaminopimelate ligase [Burkholderiales bacterium]